VEKGGVSSPGEGLLHGSSPLPPPPCHRPPPSPSGLSPRILQSQPHFSSSPRLQARVTAKATLAAEMAWMKADSHVPAAGREMAPVCGGGRRRWDTAGAKEAVTACRKDVFRQTLPGCCLEPARETAPQGASGSAPSPVAPSVPGTGALLQERSQQPPREEKGEPWLGTSAPEPPTQRGLPGRTLLPCL